MGLTRIKAGQISDIDYKQAVRVITLSNITLSGGAPNSVDGVNLAAADRILVAGQDTGSQNGLYYVQTLGTGSNGTWARTSDGNENGEIQAGMIVMVTEGDLYKDSQWKLTTNDPIVIGSSNLVFEQNSAFAFGNIVADGTAVLATAVGGVVSFVAGNNISITGNNTAKSIQFDVTGISLNSISNGTSNVNVGSSGGNVTVGVGGTNNVAVFSSSALDINGNLSITGNLTLDALSAVGNILASGLISATGNVRGGNLLTSGLLSVTSNITGGNLLTSGLISSTGSITSANGITATANITGGNLLTAIVSASGNVTGANYLTAGLISATGNVISGNLLTGGALSTVGNIYAGTNNTGYVYGNAFYMTGISSAISVTKIENGNSNVWVRDPGGDVTVTAGGVSNVAIFSTGSLAVEGAIGNPKTMAGNVIIANGINATMVGPVEFGAFNLNIPDNSTLYIIPG